MTPPRPAWPWSYETDRVETAATRHRLLTYRHERDLLDYFGARWGPQRAQAVGQSPDLRNILAQYSASMAKPGLYGEPPTVRHPDPAAADLVSAGGVLDLSGWAGLMQHAEYHVRGQGAVAVRPYVSARPGASLGFEVLHPHDLHVECHAYDPLLPVRVAVQRLMPTAAGMQWMFEVYDLSGAEPAYYLLDPMRLEGQQRITEPIGSFAPLSGDAYRWRYSDGTPFIPLVFYRASLVDFWGGPHLLAGLHRSSFTGAGLAELANFNAGSAAFQRLMLLDCDVRGGATITGRDRGQPPLQSVELLPGAMLRLEATSEERPAQVIQVPAADPGALFAQERSYTSEVLAAYGLRAPDPVRTSGGGNPTSAAALVISDRDRREGQRVLGPIFRPSDLELLSKAAALLNVADRGLALPESGYSVSYHLLPLSPEERAAEVSEAQQQYDQGLISAVDLYQVYHPGTDADGAYQAIVQSRQVEAQLRATAPAPMSAPASSPPSDAPPIDD